MRIGTIGSGSIVDLFIQSAKLVDPNCIAMVYSRSNDKAKAFAQKHGIAHYTDNLTTLFTSDLIDTVYIASPNSLHYPQALQALQHKKHVILEKPVAAIVSQYQHLMEVAKANDVLIMEAITSMHSFNLKWLKSNMDQLGPIKIIHANFSQYSSKYDAYLAGEIPNVFNPQMEGGALVDINIYNLYLTIELFGEPKSLRYLTNLGHNGIDTSGMLVLDYDGFKAVLIGAKDCAAPYGFTIEGEKATAIIDGGSSGRMHHISITSKNNIIAQSTQDDYHMRYEIADFKSAIDSHDQTTVDQWNQRTLLILSYLEKARHDGGVVYPCDSE